MSVEQALGSTGAGQGSGEGAGTSATNTGTTTAEGMSIGNVTATGASTTAVTNPALTTPANNLTTPPVTPQPTENAFDVSQYGGQEKLNAAISYYDKLASSNFDSRDFLESIAQVSPERFNAINRTVLESYMPAIQQNMMQNIAQDEEMQAAALQALGWEPQSYQEYLNYKNSGQTERLQPADPRYEALNKELNQFKIERQQQQEREIYNQRKTEYESFRNDFNAPAHDLINKMNLPDTPEGQTWRAILLGGIDNLFENYKDERGKNVPLDTVNEAFQAYMRGEGNLARNNSLFSLRAAVQRQAEQVTKLVGTTIWKAAEYDKLASQTGVRRDPLAATGQASPTIQQGQPQQTQQPNTNPNRQLFDGDEIKQRVFQRLGLTN